jgi:TRAP-type C4-dicarboxylate transport system permease small subunit
VSEDRKKSVAARSDGGDRQCRLLSGALEDGVALALFWALLIAVFLQFFTRYVLNNSIAWSEEVARYLLVLLGFVGSVTAFRRDQHISVRVLVDALPPGASRLVDRLMGLLALGLLLWCAWLAGEVMLLVRHQRLASVDVPMSWLYGVVAVAFVLMALRTLESLVRDLRRPIAPRRL